MILKHFLKLRLNTSEEYNTDLSFFFFLCTGKVADDESMFVFKNCTKQPVFYDGAFIPMFLSDFNLTTISQNIKTACGENKQCILDILLTGNEELGKATLKFEEENDAKRAALGE
jgi:hypothetical protein